MQRASALVLVTVATVGSNVLAAQAEPAVEIRISETGTCLLRNLNLPCSEVQEKLRELRIPPDAHIYLSVDPQASFYAVSAALEGLRQTSLKIGYANVQVP
jgi:biopolymer transport protein ExbD